MSETLLTNPTKGIDLPKDISKRRSFTLWYHYRRASPLTLHFEINGDLSDAVNRAKVHCERMNYRFIKVVPMIVDLDDREKRREAGEAYFQEE